jgi:type IV pilus assembly protein PilC
MPHYRYQVQSGGGQVTVGVLEATNAMEASQMLRGEGLQVLSLNPVEGASRSLVAKLKAINSTSGPSQKDILNFTTQLAVMIRAGISIRAAIEGIADQVENPKFKQILNGIKADVESGKSFSEALTKYPKQFNPLYINMVRASEMSGSFAQMLDRIAAYLDQQLETKAMVRGAMIYPAVIFVMAIVVTIFLLTFVLPRFAGVFKGKEHILPWPTVFLMGLSRFMVGYWWAVVLGLAGSVFGLVTFLRTPAGRLWFDKFKLSAPIFRGMFRALYISRSLQTMGELVNAGVPMLDTIAITGDISGNALYRQLWRRVHNAVKEGRKISHDLTRTTLLPRSVVQMISAGEESGKLGEVLDEVSTYYSKILRQAIKTATGMIEPVMILFMGALVGFIAMAIILPIFKMSSMVK